MKTDIILAGVGGQGILSIAAVLGNAALADSLYIKQSEVHGMSQRGGDVQSHLRLSSNRIYSDLIPLRKADLVISLEPMEALRYTAWLSEHGTIVTNTVPFVNIENYPSQESLEQEYSSRPDKVLIDAEKIAKESTGTARTANMVMLGAASSFIDIEYSKIRQAVRDVFARKGEQIVEMNLKALDAGRSFAQ